MNNCFSSSLFLSEVLVIVSSCVFVVMAILTAVISVTNIAFAESGSDLSKRHCHLPIRYTVASEYDIPFMNTSGSSYSAFVAYLQSSLRAGLVSHSVLDRMGYLDSPNQDTKLRNDFERIVRENLHGKKSLENLSLTTFPWLVNPNGYLKSGSLKIEQPLLEFTFTITSSAALYDVMSIKNTIYATSHPVLLEIDANASDISDKGVIRSLGSTPHRFLVYGWNDDFAGGGLILRQFESARRGHSISFFAGSLTITEERYHCPSTGNINALPVVKTAAEFDDSNELTCVNATYCIQDTAYRLMADPEAPGAPWIYSRENSIIGVFIDSNFTRTEIEFPNISELTDSFVLQNSARRIDECGYWFLPYNLFEMSESDLIAYDLGITWKAIEKLTRDCCSSSEMTSRP